ncbi:DGAT1/2-independent enzyme synthesizing storage lipids isoform X2 [Arctopsyche grandis]|uniref:DGAT1/2-independent enzyme synthesizing storage lipids isoform X2 n=1 Tax=Arctopsyche grandis TaxID=121162 RepID=UPI00406D7157
MDLLNTLINYIFAITVDYVDIDYSLWLSWLLMPLIITFLLPVVIIVLLYLSAIIFHIYKFNREKLVNTSDWKHRGRQAVAAVWDAHGWFWHGYEISGLENIPSDSPVLFIYYHGALPIDMYYFIAKLYLCRNRLIHTVADRLLFKIPGWSIILEGFHVIPGTVQQCASVLKDGNLLSISPGGVYEAQFGCEYYRLLWKKRLGFAKVALEAKVPIVPLFTMNVREAFRTVGILRRLFLRIYTLTRIPLAPIYGGFPVKLVTHVGKPIPYDGSLTPEQLHCKVAAAIEDLIETHQRIPGSITRALIERIYQVPKTKTKTNKNHTVVENDKETTTEES